MDHHSHALCRGRPLCRSTASSSASHPEIKLPDVKASVGCHLTQVRGTGYQTPRCGGGVLCGFGFCREYWINPQKNPRGKRGRQIQVQVLCNIMVTHLRRPFRTTMFHLTTQSCSYCPSPSSIWCIQRLRRKTGSEAPSLPTSQATGCRQEGSPVAGKSRRRCSLLVLKELWEGAEYVIFSCRPGPQF